MENEPKLELTFDLEKATKNTLRFSESKTVVNGQESPAPAVDTLYVQKWAAKKLGLDASDQLSLKVTIEPA